MTTGQSGGALPALIRATHPDGFRSGEWAQLVGTMEDPETGRVCYAVKFGDGAADWWPVDDPAHGYEFDQIPGYDDTREL